jgi:hypothetical protein
VFVQAGRDCAAERPISKNANDHKDAGLTGGAAPHLRQYGGTEGERSGAWHENGVVFASIALALVATMPPGGSPSPAVAPPDAYAIFARTRHYWETQTYPGFLQYTVVVTVVEHGRTKVERYESGYDGYDGTLVFDPISDYEKAHPFFPHGINIGAPSTAPGRPDPESDFFGVPMLAPNYAFGIGVTALTPAPQKPSDAELVREIRAEFHDPDPRLSAAPSPKASPGLREIAIVVSKTQAYDISLLGTEQIDGTDAFHLAMRPLRDPGKYRLRELWVDTTTYAPRKLVEALNFVTGPGTMVPWTVTFAQIGGNTYVDQETTMAPTSLQNHHYSQVTVSLENVRAVASFPRGLSAFVPEDTLPMSEP